MDLPLNLWDISLWLAITAIVLLMASEMISPYYGKANIRINKKRLKNIALAVSMAFLVTVGIRIIGIVTSG